MAEIQFKILRGLSNTLQTAAPKQLGTWYLTTDTNELFVGSGTPDNVSIEPVNQQVVSVTLSFIISVYEIFLLKNIYNSSSSCEW